MQPRIRTKAQNRIKIINTQSKLRAIWSARVNFGRIEVFLQRNVR
jgi:hypothetical protein